MANRKESVGYSINQIPCFASVKPIELNQKRSKCYYTEHEERNETGHRNSSTGARNKCKEGEKDQIGFK